MEKKSYELVERFCEACDKKTKHFHNQGISSKNNRPYENYKCGKCGEIEWIEQKEVKKWEQKMQEEPTEQDIEEEMTKKEKELLSEMNNDQNIPIINENGEAVKKMTDSQKLDEIIDMLKEILKYCKN
jgi:hypothetical protein